MVRYLKKKLVLFAAVGVVCAFVMIEGLLSFMWFGGHLWLAMHPQSSETATPAESPFTHDPDLGWIGIPGISRPDYYGKGRSVTIGGQGARGTRNYTDAKPEDRFRILCVGDSFTFGQGIDDTKTFSAQLEALDTGAEVINFGVPGYSVGQAWQMADLQAARFNPDLVLATLISADLPRMRVGIPGRANQFPKFRLTDDGFETYGVPIPPPAAKGEWRKFGLSEFAQLFSRESALGKTLKLAVRERQFGPNNVTDAVFDELLEIACRMYTDLNEKSRAANRKFAVILLPTITDISREYDRARYEYVLGHLRETASSDGFPILDLRPAFEACAEEEWRGFYLDQTMDKNEHCGAAGNKFIAGEIHRWLLETYPEYAERVNTGEKVGEMSASAR